MYTNNNVKFTNNKQFSNAGRMNIVVSAQNYDLPTAPSVVKSPSYGGKVGGSSTVSLTTAEASLYPFVALQLYCPRHLLRHSSVAFAATVSVNVLLSADTATFMRPVRFANRMLSETRYQLRVIGVLSSLSAEQ